MKKISLILIVSILFILNVNMLIPASAAAYNSKFELEFDYYEKISDNNHYVKYIINGNPDLIYDMEFDCDENLECKFGWNDETLQIIIKKHGKIENNLVKFRVLDEGWNILYRGQVIFEDQAETFQPEIQNTNEISVYVEDRKVVFDQPPIIQNGRTLVPVRLTCEALGINVEWTQQIQEVRLTKGNKEFAMRIGQSRYYTNKNGEGIYDYFDVPPQIINGRTLLPIRAVAEFFGYDVTWNGATSSVVIGGESDWEHNQENITPPDTSWNEPDVSWGEPEINFEDYIGKWETYSTRLGKYVDAIIRIVDVDLRNGTVDIAYKVDKDSQNHLAMDDKLTIDDYSYENITLHYSEKTLSNGKTAIVTDVFELLDGDKVTLILDEDENLGLGNQLGHSIIRKLN